VDSRGAAGGAPSPDAVATVVIETLDKHPGWEGAFSVIEDTRVRRRLLA